MVVKADISAPMDAMADELECWMVGRGLGSK